MPKPKRKRTPYPCDVGRGYCFERCPLETLVISEPMVLQLVSYFSHLVTEAGFTVVGETHKWYPDRGGYTITIHIEESGVTVWTWPEKLRAVASVTYCNFRRNNKDKEGRLRAALGRFFKSKPKVGGWEF